MPLENVATQKIGIDMDLISDNLELISKEGSLALITSIAKGDNVEESYKELRRITDQEIVEKDEKGDFVFTEKGDQIYRAIKKLKRWNESGLEDVGNITVLVGNDMMAAKELFERQLSDVNVEFTHTTDDFIDAVDNPDLDVILVERMLVDIDEFVSEVRQERDDIPIVVLTTRKSDESILDMEADDYLIKPIGADTLRRAVGRSIRARDRPLRERQLLFLLAQKMELEEKHSHEELQGNKHYRKTVEDFREVAQELIG